jgi:hypothetical protein
MIAPTEGRRLALAQLRQIRGDLLCARMIALQVQGQRGHELAEKIADALTLAGRLIEGDSQ